jgi:hypothetical protein
MKVFWILMAIAFLPPILAGGKATAAGAALLMAVCVGQAIKVWHAK